MQHFRPKIYVYCLLQNQTETLYMNKTEQVISEFTVKLCFKGSRLLSIPYNCAFKLNPNQILEINWNTEVKPSSTAVAYALMFANQCTLIILFSTGARRVRIKRLYVNGTFGNVLLV